MMQLLIPDLLPIQEEAAPDPAGYARFSACRTYRYALWRIWEESRPYALFIGLNPSTADETRDDPTIRRCIAFARSWGYGGIYMANLFAFRATEPADMKAAPDPIGPENDQWLVKLSAQAGIVVAAWGNDGCFLQRDKAVCQLVPGLVCLKVNKSGQPAHPLYMKASLKPVPWQLPAGAFGENAGPT